MQYEEVYLEEKIVVGISDRTQNASPDMMKVIGGLWNKFFGEHLYEMILNKEGTSVIGLYDQYQSDVNGEYDITVCTQVSRVEDVPEECVVKYIPKGKYAKFKIKGHMQKAVAEFWSELWKMDLKRSYKADFEEYVKVEGEEAEIEIYISI